MVHISDGILDPLLWEGGWAITVIILAYTLSKMKIEDVPKLSVITAAVFVASLIQFKFGPTSVHFILNGFAGVTLGLLAYPCIFVALVLQYFLFQHGGVTTIGINTVNMGVPALLAYLLFKYGMRLNLGIKRKEILFGTLGGGIAVALAVLFLTLELATTGEEFFEVAIVVATAHLPIIAIEAIFTGVVAGFLATVQPELLYRR
uniref:Cobalt transport protein CbiM n=1 Tax=Candidatus Methanogaster sp. ANME-2c ERB4 TaxID=2759911 RepID=A0A7G9YDQ0_9EURY|nr:cobalt transport protein CbiM [Methanosarcinales archaeon ANME-2c ERB4]